jgi:hypothetical protein
MNENSLSYSRVVYKRRNIYGEASPDLNKSTLDSHTLITYKLNKNYSFINLKFKKSKFSLLY